MSAGFICIQILKYESKSSLCLVFVFTGLGITQVGCCSSQVVKQGNSLSLSVSLLLLLTGRSALQTGVSFSHLFHTFPTKSVQLSYLPCIKYFGLPVSVS